MAHIAKRHAWKSELSTDNIQKKTCIKCGATKTEYKKGRQTITRFKIGENTYNFSPPCYVKSNGKANSL